MAAFKALRLRSVLWKAGCVGSLGSAIFLLAVPMDRALGQAPAPQPQTGPAQPGPAQTPAVPAANPPEARSPANTQISKTSSDQDIDQNPTVSAGAFSIQTIGGQLKEDQLKQMLTGKTLYLRGGYQDNNLEFDEHGRMTGHSTQGSFTLSQIQINKVKLSKHKLELEGDRYALHFLGTASFEDPTKATDRVKITPKKKTVRISIERAEGDIPRKKKAKEKNQSKDDHPEKNVASAASPEAGDSRLPYGSGTTRPAESQKGLTTTSEVQASQHMLAALDRVFSVGIDDRMIAAMPAFWKPYYLAAGDKAIYKPADPGIFHEDAVDQKAKLISVLDPPSNDFAQSNGVAGIAIYHAIVGSNGRVEDVVVGRPIGFGLDENAEKSIRQATFQPAMKDGKPVPVALELVVSFRIYSKRTSEPTQQQAAEEKPDQPQLPGLYTLEAEQAARGAAQPDQANPSPKPSPGPQ